MADETRGKPARPTIQAIADEAGVSRATVSLILANRRDMVERFKPETVARVRETAEAMGYHANLMALSLRSRHPSFFGLVLRGPGRRDAVSWHHQAFEGQFLAGALEASQSVGLYPVLATQDSSDITAGLKRVEGILDGGVRGAVFRTPVAGLEAAIHRQIDHGLPVVIVYPEHLQDYETNTIDMDNVEAGRLAGRLLHEAGRSKWVIVREELPWEALQLRERGACSVAQDVGANVEILAVPAGMNEKRLTAWLAPKLAKFAPDGVFASSSVTGVSALLACQVAGIRVPEDACLIGCDASLWRAPGCPGITSIDVSWYEAGHLAVQKLAELSEKGDSTFNSIAMSPHVRRGETCPGGEEDPARVISR